MIHLDFIYICCTYNVCSVRSSLLALYNNWNAAVLVSTREIDLVSLLHSSALDSNSLALHVPLILQYRPVPGNAIQRHIALYAEYTIGSPSQTLDKAVGLLIRHGLPSL
jgi:hypothetical protein